MENGAIHDLSDAQAVRDTIARIAYMIDGRRWPDLRALYADDAEIDYTSPFGGEVQRLKADSLVGMWRKMLTRLDSTQHLLGPVEVRLHDRWAIVERHVRGYHRNDGVLGGAEWMVAGHYVTELIDSAGAWKIAKVKLQALYQTGNTNLLQEAVGGSMKAS